MKFITRKDLVERSSLCLRKEMRPQEARLQHLKFLAGMVILSNLSWVGCSKFDSFSKHWLSLKTENQDGA